MIEMNEWRKIIFEDKCKLEVKGKGENIFFNEREQFQYKGFRSGDTVETSEYVLVSGKYLNDLLEEIKKERYQAGYEKGIEDGKKAYKKELLEKTNYPKKLGSRGRKSISNENISKIKEMYFDGYSIRSIAKEVGVGIGTVQKYSK
ncbi:MAG: helix-turn-helix domain-containing protein [Coxiella endosymbiont of Dermacentor silvarum]